MGLGTLNKSALNKYSLNKGVSSVIPILTIAEMSFGEINRYPVNTTAFNSDVYYAQILEIVANFAQMVGNVITGGIIVDVEQNISISSQFDSYVVANIQQNITVTIPSFIAANVSQYIYSATSSLAVRNWDLYILVGGIPLPNDVIKGSQISVTKESNQNNLCEFSVIIPNPTAFLELIEGSEVVVVYVTPTSATVVFTGVVDLPEVEIINKYITIKCSNRREELIKEQMTPILPMIGRYSKEVQGEITTVNQEVEYRLSTIPYDLNFDSFNNPSLTSWYPKTIPDVVLSNSSVYYREPKIVWQSRGSIVNKIAVTVKYNYTRLYQYQRNFTWADSGDPSFTDPYSPIWKLDSLASHLTVGMLKSAIDQAGWKPFDSLTYVDHYPYSTECQIVLNGGVNRWFFLECFNWLNDEVESTLLRQTAPPYAYSVQYKVTPPSSEEEKRIISAAWTASTRFSQNIQEVYTCQVQSTQSINQFGELTAFSNHDVTDTYDARDWEAYNKSTVLPANIVHDGVNFYANKNDNIQTFNAAILTAIDIAKTKIIASHRQTKITLQVPIIPYLELSHTVQLNTSTISCTAKVTKIKHIIDLGEKAGHYTEIELTLIRASGTAVETPTQIPARPLDSPNFETTTVAFGTRRNQPVETTPGSDTWSGYIGSINYGTKNPMKTQFIVSTPAIPDELRKVRVLNAGMTFETSIPADSLEIDFV